MKVYDYIIVFKKPSFRLVDIISQLMLLLAVLVFASTIPASKAVVQGSSLVLVVVLTGIICWWVYCIFQQKKGNTPFFRLALLLAAVGWYFQTKGNYITLIYFLAAVLEKQAKFPQEIAFDDQGVVMNSLPKKYYDWTDITNVILRDGILTIDFRNNKLIQKEIETPATVKLEQEFNEFCKVRLNA